MVLIETLMDLYVKTTFPSWATGPIYIDEKILIDFWKSLVFPSSLIYKF